LGYQGVGGGMILKCILKECGVSVQIEFKLLRIQSCGELL
jgi:hypothetical protein